MVVTPHAAELANIVEEYRSLNLVNLQDKCLIEAISTGISETSTLDETIRELENILSVISDFAFEVQFSFELSKNDQGEVVKLAQEPTLMSAIETLRLTRKRFESDGVGDRDGYFMDLSDTIAARYFDKRSKWRSVSLERIMLQYLVTLEAERFANCAFTQLISPFELLVRGCLGLKEPLPFSAKASTKSAISASVRFASVFLGLVLIAGISSTLSPSEGQFPSNFWGLVSVCAGSLAIALFSLSVLRTFNGAIEKGRATMKRKAIELASEMIQFAANIGTVRSPSEAKLEFERLHNLGARWPNPAWLILMRLHQDNPVDWGQPLYDHVKHPGRRYLDGLSASQESSLLVELDRYLVACRKSRSAAF